MKDREEIARFEVKFVFGDSEAHVWDKTLQRGMRLPMEEPMTQENFEVHFMTLVVALHEAGMARSDDLAVCVTYPAGTRISPNKDHLIKTALPENFTPRAAEPGTSAYEYLCGRRDPQKLLDDPDLEFIVDDRHPTAGPVYVFRDRSSVANLQPKAKVN